MYSWPPSSLSVRCQREPAELSDLSASFHGAGRTASRRLCIRFPGRYLDDAKMVGVLWDGHDYSECSPRLWHVDPRDRLTGVFGENLDTGRERIASRHAGQGTASRVTGVDVIAGVLDP